MWRKIPLLLLFVTSSLMGAAKNELAVNPHWSDDAKSCLECHEAPPRKGKPIKLRLKGDINRLCNRCHSEISKDKYIHATGMLPTHVMLDKMSDGFRSGLDSDGRITCAVCHEMTYQCLKEEYWRKADNRLFHRGAPYEKRTEICYECHEPSAYKKIDPHDQITDEGDLNSDMCTFCHAILPDRHKVKSIVDVSFKIDDFDMLCLRCHTDDAYAFGCVTGFEKDGRPKYHKGTPDEVMTGRIEAEPSGAILPLDFINNTIFCGTCHNPHELGVQLRHEADIGADSHKRLRISLAGSRLCLGCHDQKEVKSFTLP